MRDFWPHVILPFALVVAVVVGAGLYLTEPKSVATGDGALIIEHRTITAVEIEGSRCILATDNRSTALSCDHTFGRRQGE